MPSSLLTAADRVRAAALPTSEIGHVLPEFPGASVGLPGWSVIEAQAQQHIPVSELRWPQSVETFESMRRDSQIQGLLQSVFLPIRHMDWYVDPAGTTGTVAEEIAEDFGLGLLGEDAPEDGPGLDFDDHLRLALLALAIGHRFFEETGEIVGAGSAARYRLRRLSDRPPETIAFGGRINVASNGDLVSIQQTGGILPDPIPADRLLAYVWDREGGNWAGRPLLFGIFRNWLIKDQLIRADAVKHVRFNGIPIGETTDPSVGPEAHAKTAEMAQLLQSGQGAGASLPYGVRMRLLGVEGTLPDTIASVNYHDQQMARAFMQMFAELGNTQHGSRALGLTLVDHYSLGVLAISHWARRSLMALVRRIVLRNYGPGAAVPQVKFRQDDREDLTAEQLVALIDAGAIVVDDELEAVIRERGNLPPRNPAEPGRAVPGQAPVAPAAASRRPSPRRGIGALQLPDRPLRRQPYDHEVRAAVNFAALDTAWAQTDTDTVTAVREAQGAQVDELHTQIEQSSGDLARLAAIAATPIDHTIISSRAQQLARSGRDSALAEAAAQGHTIGDVDLAPVDDALDARAAATATVLARSISEAAARKALEVGGAGTLPSSDVADQVAEHLSGLTDAFLHDTLGGVMTQAQNSGRREVMAAGQPERIYASELLDENTCGPCSDEDGTEFGSLAEAEQDYPSGGFVGCDGGPRCRGTLVAVYPESAPSS